MIWIPSTSRKSSSGPRKRSQPASHQRNLPEFDHSHDKKEIQINGGILIKEYGYQPGPDLGEILTEIEFAIVDGELENDRQAIHTYLREKK